MFRVTFVTVVLCCSWAGGAELDPVEAVGEYLGGEPQVPWYDSTADDFQPVNVYPSEQPRTAQEPPTELRWGVEGLLPFGQAVGWTILGAFLLALAGVIIWALLRRESREAVDVGRGGKGPASADRFEELPVSVPRGETSLLAAARREYEGGNFGQAIIYLFSYQLLELDSHQLIRLTRGKTNRQYLRELSSQPSLRPLLGATIEAFEEVFFGGRDLDRERFERCWRELDRFHQLVGGRA